MAFFKLLLFFSFGMFVIIKGADLFIDSAVWIAARMRISRAVMGATLVSLATTLPEFSVSVFASYTGHAEMSLGNAVGSNIFNIGCILGLALLLGGSRVERGSHLRHCTFMVGAGVLAWVLSLDGQIARLDGVLLLGVLIFNYIELFWPERKTVKKSAADENPELPTGTLRSNALKFFLGAIAVIIGSRVVLGASVALAKSLGVPEIIIGLTLVAMGTSLPELATAITSTLKGYQELSVGNILGAGLLNICWVTAMSAMVRPIPIELANIVVDFPFMLLLMILLLSFGMLFGKLQRFHGIIFLLIYGIYIHSLFIGHM